MTLVDESNNFITPSCLFIISTDIMQTHAVTGVTRQECVHGVLIDFSFWTWSFRCLAVRLHANLTVIPA